MSLSEKQPACAERKYTIGRNALPLSCPTDAMEIWNAHPKVYLPIEKTGHCACPYCGAEYTLVD